MVIVPSCLKPKSFTEVNARGTVSSRGSDRPKVSSVQHSAEPSVVNSTKAEPSVVLTERDLRLIEKIVINAKYHRHFKKMEKN